MTGYVGRFAPTPSGPLHFGSITTALGSYLDARRAGGRWLLRVDDIDAARVRRDAINEILHGLEQLGLYWDGDPNYQSIRKEAYADAVARLEAAGFAYACSCPRRLVAGRIYPGTCRARPAPGARRHSLRVRTDNRIITINDGIQGTRRWRLEPDVGDFIIYRADRVYAYHLATALDDAWQGINHVVRGADLLDATPPQVYLQQLLGLPLPAYRHLPLVLDTRGRKLSKSGKPHSDLLRRRPARLLVEALAHLGQQVDPEMEDAGCEEILSIAARRWDPVRVPREAPPGAAA